MREIHRLCDLQTHRTRDRSQTISAPPRQYQFGLPEYPWQRVASDLFELDKKTYLLVADYFSRYVEVQTLTSTTSASIICTLKSIFAQHSIPETFVSDNGPQYSSQEMKDFARDYNFATLPAVHTTLRGMG